MLEISLSCIILTTVTETMQCVACMNNYTPHRAPDEPLPAFNETDTITELREKYRLHEAPTVLVDVDSLNLWRFFRRPHKDVVLSLAALMKVIMISATTISCAEGRDS